jgi:hypothetical protein
MLIDDIASERFASNYGKLDVDNMFYQIGTIKSYLFGLHVII